MFKTLNKTKVISLAFYVLLFFILLQNSFSYLDHDLGWHLEVGRQSIIDKDVARADLYDYPLQGLNWVDHEWLTNIFVYLIFDNLGYIVLSVLFALLIVASFWIINYHLQNYFERSFPLAGLFIIELLAIYGMMPHLGVRMQELGVFFLSLLFLMIAHFQKTKNQRLLWLWPFFFLLWLNLHASFLVGLFALWSFFFYELLSPLIKDWPIFNFFQFKLRLNRQEKTNLLIACLLSTLAALLTPYGLEYFYFLYTYSSPFYMMHIAEWLPAWTYPVQHFQLIYSALVATVILLPIVLKEKKRHNIWHLFLTVFFFLMAFRSRRHFPLFVVASLPLLINYLFLEIQNKSNKIFPNQKIFKFIKNPYLVFFLISAYLLILTHLISNTHFNNQPFQDQKYCRYYPCGILNHINSNNLSDKRLLNDYSWGGWLIYTRPGKQIFIDGRIPQYQYEDRSFMEEYYDFFKPEKIEGMLAKHEIEMVIQKHKRPFRVNWLEKGLGLREETINSNTNHYKDYFEASPEWEKVYEDNVGYIYLKK